MIRGIVLSAALVGLSSAALCAEEFNIHANALVCDSPYRIMEGYKAANAEDWRWFRETGCSYVERQSPIIVIDEDFEGGLIWKVRVRPEGKQGETVYTFRCELRTSDGQRLPRC